LIAFFLLPLDQYFHQWVQTEWNKANKRKIAVVEAGFPWQNVENLEYVPLDRNQLLKAFLRLTTTLGNWRREAGRRVLVRLRPDMIGRFAARNGSTCRYRLCRAFEPVSDWVTVTPAADATGIGFPVAGVLDNVHIEVNVTGAGTSYFSVVDPQFVSVELQQDAG
jgi:hypothetical protein